MNTILMSSALGQHKADRKCPLPQDVLLSSLFTQKGSPIAARFVRICLHLELATVAMLDRLYLQQ